MSSTTTTLARLTGWACVSIGAVQLVGGTGLRLERPAALAQRDAGMADAVGIAADGGAQESGLLRLDLWRGTAEQHLTPAAVGHGHAARQPRGAKVGEREGQALRVLEFDVLWSGGHGQILCAARISSSRRRP